MSIYEPQVEALFGVSMTREGRILNFPALKSMPPRESAAKQFESDDLHVDFLGAGWLDIRPYNRQPGLRSA